MDNFRFDNIFQIFGLYYHGPENKIRFLGTKSYSKKVNEYIRGIQNGMGYFLANDSYRCFIAMVGDELL
jgi:hypothetical protein